MPENNNQTALQLTYRVENNQVVFDGYRLIDNRGNAINNQDSWYDDFVNSDLSSSVLTTLEQSLRVGGASSASLTTVFGVNVALTAVQNFRETGDNGYRDEIIAGINTAVEVGITTAYGFLGAAIGAPGGPVTAVAGAVSFSYAAQQYYQNNVEEGFANFLNQSYDYLFDENVQEAVISYDEDRQQTVIYNNQQEFWYDQASRLILGEGDFDSVELDNSLLDLTINTDLDSNFRPTSNPTQTGNAIDGGDYYIESDISVLNGDGAQNTAPMGILTDQYRPGNVELSTSEGFAREVAENIVLLNQGQGHDVLADLTNQAIDAQSFVNIDPVILDLNNNNRIDLISYQDSQVTFDVDNDNRAERTGWVSGSEGILVYDKNGDGRINNITETISEYFSFSDDEWRALLSGQGAANQNQRNPFVLNPFDNKYSDHGLEALSKLDTNNDNVLDANDAIFDQLKIWQDLDENGVTDAGELMTLNEAGVRDFDLSNILEIDRQRNEGNVVLAQSSFTTIYGQTRLTQAVDFTTNPIGYEFNDVNLGTLATSEEGTRSLSIGDENGAVVNAANENVQNIFGNDGGDEITGDDGDNWLSGGGGSDILRGGDGDDILIIDENDLQQNIDGGDGRDIVIINSDRSVSFNLTQANVETAIGGNGDDVLIGGGLANVFIDGGSGDDVIIGGAADDALSGSDGDDLIDGGYGDDVIRGHRGDDVLIGGEGDDLIDGGFDDDQLSGNDGTDILIGGKGNDIIDGGDGYDLAKYSGSYNNYQIYKEGSVIRVRDLTTQDIDTLENIEGIRFDDVTIDTEGNTAPMAVSDQILVDGSLTEIFIAKADLLSNDIDLERDILDIRAVENAVGGQVELVRDSSGVITGVRFTPDQAYSGVMSFDYSVIDEHGNYSEVTLHNNDGTSQQADHKARVQFKLNDDPTDPLYYDQWYLSEINVKDVWDEYKGDGVTVGVFEDGDFNRHHQDLRENVLASHAQDQEFRQVDRFSQHKTTVAGVIAAQDNDYGIIGIAPNASLDGYSWNGDDTGLAHLKNVDVANNSWGVTNKFADNFSGFGPYRVYKNLIEESVREGRNGLGTVNVFAGGNGRESGDNVNYHNLQNSRFVITTGSINQEGDLGALVEASTPFSNPGSAILVSAPGSNIQSTGNLLENANGSTFLGEFSSSQGTSFSAPIVSGVVALMLEANPSLGYRDVQKILAYSARKFEDENTVWRENGADNFNGGALHYSEDYGFGIVDAKAAVRLAESWGEVNNYFNEEFFGVSGSILDSSGRYRGGAVFRNLNDNGIFEAFFRVSDSNMHNIENVELSIDILHDDISELKFILTSPSGTQSILLDKPQDSVYDGRLNFAFSSRHFLGEEVDGNWRLQIIDDRDGNVGYLRATQLKFYGKLDDGQDDVYIYTNEIAALSDGSRAVIRDDGGIDTINAVAVDGDSIINLNPGEITRFSGRDLVIASGGFTDEYYQYQSQLESQRVILSGLESQFSAARDLVAQKQGELQQVNQQIPIKHQEYQNRNVQLQLAINEVAQARVWLDNHVYDHGINYGGGNIVYYFIRQSDGVIISISRDDYNAIENNYNAKARSALDLQSQVNSLVDEYNALLSRSIALTQEINDATSQVNDISQQVQTAQRDIQDIQNILDSFTQGGDTIIENAYSGDGNDRLIGNDYDNRLMAGRGENVLTGGDGRDIFVIKKGAISDIITDFVVGQDRIDVSEFNTSFGRVQITQDGADTLIAMPNGQTITLQNVDQGQVTQNDLIFVRNEAAVAQDDAVNVQQRSSATIDILANDSDDETILTKDNIVIVRNPQSGSVIVNNDGTLTYTNTNFRFVGVDEIEYYLVDDEGLISNVATVQINVEFVNHEPVARFTRSLVGEDGFVQMDALSNAYDANGDILTIDSVTNGDHGVAQIIDGKIIYAPNEGFVGQDVIEYTISDGRGGSAIQSITIDVNQLSERLGTRFEDSLSGSFYHNVGLTGSAGYRIEALEGDDIIYSNVGGDVIYGGLGNDYISISGSFVSIIGGQGGDIFSFRPPYSQTYAINIIKDFEINNNLEKIDLRFFAGIDFSDLNIYQVGSDSVIEINNDNKIILKDVNRNDLTADNFIFYDRRHAGSALDDYMYLYGHDDDSSEVSALEGNGGDDELIVASGSATLIGGNGNDRFVINDFSISYTSLQSSSSLQVGIITINDFEFDNSQEKIVINSQNVTSFDDLILTQQGGDVLIELGENGQQIILRNIVFSDLTADNFEISYSDHNPNHGYSGQFSVVDGVMEGTNDRDILYSNYPYDDYVSDIYGLGGDDYIYSYGYETNIYGGDDDDSLVYYNDDGGNNTVMNGGNGNDHLLVYNGSPILVGGNDGDFFEIKRNPGSNIIIRDFEFNNLQEVIDLSDFEEINNLQDLNLEQDGSNAIINLPDSQRIILQNININDLSVNNFILILSNKDQSGEIIDEEGSNILLGRGGIDSFVMTYDPGSVDEIRDLDIAQERVIIRDFAGISEFSDLDITYHKNEYASIPEYFALVNFGEGQFLKIKNVTQNNPLTVDNFAFENNYVINIVDNTGSSNRFLLEDIFVESLLQNRGVLPALENIDGRQVSPDPITSHVMTIDQNGEVIVTFKNSVAGYKNAIGWYEIGRNGEMLSPQLLFKNAKSVRSNTEFSLGNLDQGARIGFFLIADGGNGHFIATDHSEISHIRNMDFSSGEFSFVDSDGGIATVFDDNSPTLIFTRDLDNREYFVNKHVYHSYNNRNLNPDGELHGGAGWDSQRQELLLGFEDLYGGGDRDYNDILFYLRTEGSEDLRQSDYVNAPSINVDLDGEGQSQEATLEITNAQEGDRLIFDNNNFIIDGGGNISRIIDLGGNVIQDLGIMVSFSEDNGQITISGEQSIDIYQEVINSIKFINVSGGDGADLNVTRDISIRILSESDILSAIETQIIIVGNPIFGTSGNDSIVGGDNNDFIISKSGDDVVEGGLGDDILIGGAGRDILTGGFGSDSFNFESLDDSSINSCDLIADFSQGEDSINFSNLGFIGIQEGPGQGDVLGYSYDSGFDITIIEDAESDFAIKLSGQIELNEGDFVF